MANFIKVNHKTVKYHGKERIVVEPSFVVRKRYDDLMVRGGSFYAIFDSETGFWSTDLSAAAAIIDREIDAYVKTIETTGLSLDIKYATYHNTGTWEKFFRFLRELSDSYIELDTRVIFNNTEVTRKSYASRALPYNLEEGDASAFYALYSVLYDEDNLRKLMWSIGSIISGDSVKIQKFYVLFGAPGTGKSTALNLIETLFTGYTANVRMEAFVGRNNSFAAEMLRDNPLVAMDHEGDLSNIVDNSIISNIVSHDRMSMNVKFKSAYDIVIRTALFVATNRPVKITSKMSGLNRRLLDIVPTGDRVSPEDYDALTKQMGFQLGAIGSECLKVYKKYGFNYYSKYSPKSMVHKTNEMYNFVNEYAYDFVRREFITLREAWSMYKEFQEESMIRTRMNLMTFREEFKLYWNTFNPEQTTVSDGKRVRSAFFGFKTEEVMDDIVDVEIDDWLALKEQPSGLDTKLATCKAQLGNAGGLPNYKWENVKTTLADISTDELHFVLPPKNLVTLDFDIKDADGNKSLALNIEAAKEFPPTYAETSKGGQGLHLHYYYKGELEDIDRLYSDGIEILKPVGLFSIRRKLTDCNSEPINTISSGLPKKESKPVVSQKTIATEHALRKLIFRNLGKEIHAGTKPSVDFIGKILQDTYDQGLRYDVSDLETKVMIFASMSSNHAPECMKAAANFKYESDHDPEDDSPAEQTDGEIIFFDIEIYPNLMIVCWKREDDPDGVTWYNPSSAQIRDLVANRLIGFNNRRYDNHILYGRLLGYTNERLYLLSKSIIEDRTNSATFREAWDLSYTDIYDYAATKQSLKHWEVELGLSYDELDFPWDEPLDEEHWKRAAEYCMNDVFATQAVHEHLKADFQARLILSELSGLIVNKSTMSHASEIIFGKDKKGDKHKKEFKHPDLSEEFPGYRFDAGVSYYRGETVGEGGYVYSEPGMYGNVWYMDVTSMHPTSLVQMDLFGKYTHKYDELMAARVAIKKGQIDVAGKMFDGKLKPFLEKETLVDLAYALKIALNIVYGYTSAHFNNVFKDLRNRDNVVAKRGALFMIDLKHALWGRGAKPVHFKTDSVKLVNPTEEDIAFVHEFGRKYGYTFGLEGIFDRMALVNRAVLIGKWKDSDKWEAVGAQFAHPYVYKTLFSRESIFLEDMVETRSVRKGQIFIERDGEDHFVGRIGQFVPVKKGGKLWRIDGEKRHAVTGTSDWEWEQVDVVRKLNLEIDRLYFENLVIEAMTTLSDFGDVEMFKGE